MKASELGIFLLPEEFSTPQLPHFFNEKIKNIPHLSLYQGCFQENAVIKLRSIFKDKTNKEHKIIAKMKGLSIQEGNLFWNVHKDSCSIFSEWSDFVISKASELRDRDSYLRQILDTRELDSKKKKLVSSFGIYWIKEFFQPHITLFYKHAESLDRQFIDELNQSLPKKMTFLPELHLGEIGYSGNLEKIVF